ncbi:hypothetical protein MKZ38_005018 [Zalerion maritima]|uniref:Uncharacterized protein n=1 Tax=Zalerion maritima TaxID=339359 RepID=A0AAD5RRG5_9PEZI|nr:hypothetical protein MKZ38_005018 [Zalerion maritima]
MAANSSPSPSQSASNPSFWSTTWDIFTFKWLWSSGQRRNHSLAPPIPTGTIHMVVKDRKEPPNWGGVVICHCSNVERFWNQLPLSRAPTSASWTSVQPGPDRGANFFRKLWSGANNGDVVERLSQTPRLWKQRQSVLDKETGDSCTATLYIRDIELFLSGDSKWQFSRRGPPSVLWLSSLPAATPDNSEPESSTGPIILKPIPNSSTTWKQGWTWRPVPGLTQLPSMNWFAELSTEKYDRERLVRELESANKNLEETAQQMERTTTSLAGIAPGVVGITAALTGVGVELDGVRKKIDIVVRRVESLEVVAGNARRISPTGSSSPVGSEWQDANAPPPAYSRNDPYARAYGT